MRALLVSPLGFLIGLSLGALGGGGSILAVPVLVYVAGQGSKQATASSLVLVTISALVGIVPHWRANRVRLGAGTVFGLAGIGGSLLGSHWNSIVDKDVLLLAFAGVMLIAGWAMWRRADASGPAMPVTTDPATTDPATTDPASTTVPVDGRAAAHSTVRVDLRTTVSVLVAGSVVGLLTGLFGVGGGFVIVPALVLALGFSMPEAVGTSLLVISINAVVALSTRLQGGNLEWSVIVPFGVASIAGVIAGSRMAGTREPAALKKGFVVLLVAVAVYTATRSALAIW